MSVSEVIDLHRAQDLAQSAALQLLASRRLFGGLQQRYRHHSRVLGCPMQFSIYLPPMPDRRQRVPVLYWLSGLTCNDENFMDKAGAQRLAALLGMALVAPDTSPRGEAVADDPAYDLGQGAGFYVNATQAPWDRHYQMYDYLLQELPPLIEEAFPVSERRAISGHSMGGHGALILAIRNPGRYASASAFSPICNPANGRWGRKAFAAYLGEDESQWKAYDASMLLAKARQVPPLLVDQGGSDEFLESELMPDVLEMAAKICGSPIQLRRQAGYDHSYCFVASFIESHLCFHAAHLGIDPRAR